MNVIEINRIKEVVGAVIDVPVSQISDNTSMDEIDAWDSLAQMNLVIALEDEFQITIPDYEVGTIISIQLILSLVNELVN